MRGLNCCAFIDQSKKYLLLLCRLEHWFNIYGMCELTNAGAQMPLFSTDPLSMASLCRRFIKRPQIFDTNRHILMALSNSAAEEKHTDLRLRHKTTISKKSTKVTYIVACWFARFMSEKVTKKKPSSNNIIWMTMKMNAHFSSIFFCCCSRRCWTLLW